MAIDERTAAILAVLPLLLFFMWYWLAVRRWKHHVWVSMDLDEGKSVVKRFRPGKDGILDTQWGLYYTHPHAFTLFRGKPLFRFAQGDMNPIRYDKSKVVTVSKNPGNVEKITYVVNAKHVTIPAGSASVFFKQHLFRDAYARSVGLILLLILGFGFIAIMIIGLYMRQGG
jgi:hypothetical protein